MGIEAYSVALIDTAEQSNIWYAILSGATNDSLESETWRMELVQNYELEQVKVVCYNNMGIFFVEVDWESVTEVERIKTETPDLPENIFKIAQKFPQSNLFYVQNVFLFNFPRKSIPNKYYQGFNNAKLDLPRGISKREVTKQASALAEVIYKDNLYGDQVTVDIIKLRDGEEIASQPRLILTQNNNGTVPNKADNIAWYYAAQILNTGRYRTEKYEPIEVRASEPLFGYKVLIEPRNDYFRTYFVLADENGEYAVFSQSTDKSDEEILDYLQRVGSGMGCLRTMSFITHSLLCRNAWNLEMCS